MRIIKCLFLISVSSLLTFSCTAQSDRHQPNIIIVMADDLDYSDIGCYGGEIQTPHLDELAENGIFRVQNHYRKWKSNCAGLPTEGIAVFLQKETPTHISVGLMNIGVWQCLFPGIFNLAFHSSSPGSGI